jgi:probable addiction module antidote protein
MRTSKSTKPSPPCSPWRAADYLKSNFAIAVYIEATFEEYDSRALPTAFRTVADAAGGVAALAKKIGISRAILNRTIVDDESPSVDTVIALFKAYKLRISVAAPAKKKRSS